MSQSGSLSFVYNAIIVIAFIGYTQLTQMTKGFDAGAVTTAQVGNYIGVYPTNSLTFSQAQDYCQNILGVSGLATINCEKDNLNAADAARDAGVLNRAWIGLNDINSEGNFEWIDGTIFDQNNAYSAWSYNNPDNFRNNEDCVHFWLNYNTWNDGYCNSPVVDGFICNADTLELSCGTNTCDNYDSNYFFSHPKHIAVVRDNQMGIINIGEQLQITFDMVLTANHIGKWATILHIGNENLIRLPGFWLSPKKNELNIIMSESNEDNDVIKGYQLVTGILYSIKVTVCNGIITYYINDEIILQTSKLDSKTANNQAIWIGDPFELYVAAPVVVSNIVIQPCIGQAQIVDTQCMEDSKGVCRAFYDVFCDSCGYQNNTGIMNSWLENCGYDFCSLKSCNKNVNKMDLFDAINGGCLDSVHQECLECS